MQAVSAVMNITRLDFTTSLRFGSLRASLLAPDTKSLNVPYRLG
jgi:hypothetical protein